MHRPYLVARWLPASETQLRWPVEPVWTEPTHDRCGPTAARLQENVCCSTRSGNHDASSLIFVIKLDLLCTLSMLEEVRRDSEVYWPQYSLRQVHAHIYTEMKPRTQ